ncbi:unnamed protein product [Adineta steineri]|uniref:Uncharacterized protein n=1 Tax=Adineta steineri TaxID=433720 RepID=A0A816EDC4_9BILA|nr:unnamed protein product [Adineta steineri]CAF1644532.1 unnamed protein product [Adineta steineri]
MFVLFNYKQVLNKPFVIIGTQIHLPRGFDEEDLSEEFGVTYSTSTKIIYGHLTNLKLYLLNMKDMASFGGAFRFIATYLRET